PWSRSEEESRASVVVLGATAAARLFPHGHAVGRSVTLGGHAYRVVGVLRPWHLQPRIYDLTDHLYQETEGVFLPFTTAVDRQLQSFGEIACPHPVTPGFAHELH